MTEDAPIGNDEPRKPARRLFAEVVNVSGPEQDENDPISSIDCPFCRASRLAPAALARDPCHGRRGGGATAADAATRRRAAAAMTASGMWFSPPRGAIAVPATASPSPSSAAACRRPAVAGSPARSIAAGRSRSGLGRRLPGEWRWPACRRQRRGLVARHHHRRPLQRHLAGDAELVRVAVACSPDGAQRNPGAVHTWIDLSRIALRSIRATKTKRPAGRPDGPFTSNRSLNSNQRGASTMTT